MFENIKYLNVDLISDDLYDAILEEFRKQHGEGSYEELEISAEKEKEEE